MQSVGMRSVGRFFRNATKTQKKVLKKSIVLDEKARARQKEVLLRRKEKNPMADSTKNKRRSRSALLKWKYISKLYKLATQYTIFYARHKIPLCKPWMFCFLFIDLVRYHFFVSTVIYYSSISTILTIVKDILKKNTHQQHNSIRSFIKFHWIVTEFKPLIGKKKDSMRSYKKNLGSSKTEEFPYVLKTRHFEWTHQGSPDRTHGSSAACCRDIVDTKPTLIPFEIKFVDRSEAE